MYILIYIYIVLYMLQRCRPTPKQLSLLWKRQCNPSGCSRGSGSGPPLSSGVSTTKLTHFDTLNCLQGTEALAGGLHSLGLGLLLALALFDLNDFIHRLAEDVCLVHEGVRCIPAWIHSTRHGSMQRHDKTHHHHHVYNIL